MKSNSLSSRLGSACSLMPNLSCAFLHPRPAQRSHCRKPRVWQNPAFVEEAHLMIIKNNRREQRCAVPVSAAGSWEDLLENQRPLMAQARDVEVEMPAGSGRILIYRG